MIQYRTLNCNGKLVSLDTPAVMGIINVTSDSFYKGSRIINESDVLNRITQMKNEGVLMVDLGAMSSRPGASIISPEDEWSKLSAVLPVVREYFPELILSVDTLHSATAAKALDCGVDIVNDISGGIYDPAMMSIVGRYDVPFVVMHMKGQPENMQKNPVYDNVITEVFDFFTERIAEAEKHGIVDVILDPGFGFGKALRHNYQLLQNLHVFEILRYPVLAGMSRKGMIQQIVGQKSVNALNGTTAAHMLALMNGARILRVHDVKEAVECIKIWEKFNNPDADFSATGSYNTRV